GIPAHNMMVGITSWQQQVPLPQCYNGTNAWSIPLNPVMAATPVPVNNKHFLRGAIALAANGVPIFNPYTNTGVDAFLDGQLDQWGGHSGRADDYHYHNAPMFLEKPIGPTLPIAFALDGFAVYGNKEPDGSAMKTLDANHGHWGTDGRYHYHGSAAAPYMIGQMAGVVTEDTTLQIIPQPAAKGVRPALTPLKGATITGFHPNGGNGYTLIYTLNGATDSVVYRWTSSGAYTYDFYTASGKTTSNYQGKAPCIMPSGIRYLNAGSVFEVFPNPAAETLSLSLGAGMRETDILHTFITDLNGRVVWQQSGFAGTVNLNGFRSGLYLLSVETKSGRAVRRVVVQP
ncbi:MAG: T9SS type A sorting domain-containing protein, partial [Bacteroidetes bacterium]|nr:T9SS type A sorting domain-containing protein [Bacteroidota bacterium]